MECVPRHFQTHCKRPEIAHALSLSLARSQCRYPLSSSRDFCSSFFISFVIHNSHLRIWNPDSVSNYGQRSKERKKKAKQHLEQNIEVCQCLLRTLPNTIPFSIRWIYIKWPFSVHVEKIFQYISSSLSSPSSCCSPFAFASASGSAPSIPYVFFIYLFIF